MSETREVKVGVRIHMPPDKEGLRLFGHDEVNQLISQGWKVEAIGAGGVVFNKTGEKDGFTSLVISGCDMKVILSRVMA